MNDAEIGAGLAPTPHYRYADLVGDRLYIAGQVPLDAHGNVVGDDAGAQAVQCVANLTTLVVTHGFARDDIHHLVIYVVGDGDARRAAWAAVTASFDGEVPPATLLGVSGLGYDGQLVEIDAQVDRGR